MIVKFPMVLLISILVMGLIPLYSQGDALLIHSPRPFVSRLEGYVGTSYSYPKLYYRSPGFSRQFRMAYSLGIKMHHQIRNKFEIIGGFFIERKRYRGTIRNPDNLYQSIIGDLKNDYLTTSIVPNYRLNKNFVFGIGLYVSYLSKSQASTLLTDPSNMIISLSNNDTSNLFSSCDYGLAINIGYEFTVGKAYFFRLELSNSYGLKSINKLTTPNLLAIEKNNTLFLGLSTTIKK